MSDPERLRVLRATSQFLGSSKRQMRAMLAAVDEVCVPAGTVLARQGRLCHEFVIVSSGTLETCRDGRAGWLGRGDSFGWSAMRDRGVNDATVTSLSSARLLVMSHEQFRIAEGITPTRYRSRSSV